MTIQSSGTLGELAAALSKFQGEAHGAAKKSVNPHLKNKYADLSSIWDAIREPLAANGLAVTQLPLPGDAGTIHLATVLLHSSGEWLSSELVLPVTKNDAQGFGSALTYARRYMLAAILGITQEDDDGHAASRRDKPAAVSIDLGTGAASFTPATPAPKAMADKVTPPGERKVTQAQLTRLYALAGELGVSTEACKELLRDNFPEVQSSKDLTRSQYDALEGLIRAKAEAADPALAAVRGATPPDFEFEDRPVDL